MYLPCRRVEDPEEKNRIIKNLEKLQEDLKNSTDISMHDELIQKCHEKNGGVFMIHDDGTVFELEDHSYVYTISQHREIETPEIDEELKNIILAKLEHLKYEK